MKNGISSAMTICVGLVLLLATNINADALHYGVPEPFRVRPIKHSPPLGHATFTRVAARPAIQPHNTQTRSNANVASTGHANLSPEAREVVKLYRSGVSNEAILNYVIDSHADFKLSVADVNYLKDIGISTQVVFAMIRNPDTRERIAYMREKYLAEKSTNAPTEQPSPSTNGNTSPNQPTNPSPEQDNSHYYEQFDNTRSKEQPRNFYPNYAPVPGSRYQYDDYSVRPGDPGYNGYNGYNSYNDRRRSP